MALAVSLTYPWHPVWLLVFLGNTPALTLGWVGGPRSLSSTSPPPVTCPQGSPKGPFPEDVFSS